ncbi:hypothetical protein BDV96DRAFT_595446 [Lophiotrema nucula]|uniref:Uncharacterized protein n=1 Tax=Lophiotrema nucula TaxID=690887 RepID=A0A6A5ZJP9_9PLEO|nr:hypothetical protein BDV96DRAFT_595446 [Lophiotrema nucula]
MPKTIHVVLVGGANEQIHQPLRDILLRHPEVYNDARLKAAVAKVITTTGHNYQLNINGYKGIRKPDVAWHMNVSGYGDPRPAFVSEMSWSPRLKGLEERCIQWILGSRGECRLAMGLNVDYDKDVHPSGSEFGLLAYKAPWAGQTRKARLMFDKVVRDAGGNMNEGFRFRISVRDLAPNSLCDDMPDEIIVELNSALLCSWLDRAAPLKALSVGL